MRAAIVTSLYPSRNRATVGTFVRDQAIALSRAGVEVEILHIDVRSPRTIGRADGVSDAVIDDPSEPRAHRWKGWGVGTTSVPPLMRLGARRLRRTLHAPPDVIHGHFAFGGGIAAAALADAYDRPLVITEHSSEFARGLATGSRGAEIRRVFARADRLLAVSNELAATLSSYSDRAVRVIPNVVDVDSFAPRRPAAVGTPMRIVSVGSLTTKKGFDHLLEALVSLPFQGWRATIVGEGPEGRRLRRLADVLEIGDRVELPGALSRARIRELLAGADVFVSSSRNETFGIAIAEALSVGVPVVATRSGGPASFVEQPYGLLVESNPPAIAEGINQVARGRCTFDPEVSHRRIARMFGPSLIADRVMSVYEEVLPRGG
jgi:glycosyltransferase involved in cell wall biosynthesis